MREQISGLIEVLQAEYGIYSEVLELSKIKKSVIADGKIDELDKIIKSEQIFLVRINDIEQKRLKMVSEVARAAKIYKKDVTTADILKVCDAVEEEKLKEIINKLSETLKEQIHYNEINSKMVKDRLEYINFMLAASKGAAEQTNNYGAKGVGIDQNERKKTSMIDHKA